MIAELFDKIIDKKTIDHDEWLKTRQTGIGGSEASVIVGQNPYSSKLKLYMSKTQAITEEDKARTQNEATRQGNDLEKYVAERFTEETGKKVQNCNFILRSKAHPVMIADLDRVVVGENSFVECKTTKNYDNYKFDEGEYPAYWFWQIQHYFVVTGCTKCYLCVLDFGRGFHIIEVEPNEDAMKILTELEEKFWDEHITAKIVPYADNPADTEELSKIYKADDNIPTIDLASEKELFQTYAELNNKQKEIEDTIEGYKNRLKQLLGNGTCGSCDTYKISWKEQTSNRVDTKKLQANYPEIYKECVKSSTTRVFRFSNKN